mmetsp:Transcript_30748/g.60440  ORF Transcript_30748/g.60440 Transcript_30748/m.60440 type:complete len:377 (-) Transcript_30748:128-1258(-)|eukprot:CAMPEP_0172710344 /NCGR_PEP_ID=MMETSP1074-20121228/55602_1 /TAXON_ID=2916 /ORGANISM="Ceratium fusus, Strain PA161109" /LENGTH=376 /DNA_ID=CAMNT_0013533729 /DNA_START=81 /DNA_END=1211 /DNA_ORIENTATION=-
MWHPIGSSTLHFGGRRVGCTAASASRLAMTAALLSFPSAAVTIWETGQPQGGVEVREDFMTPQELFANYMGRAPGRTQGVGKPALLKGAAMHMPAFSRWTDEYLREHHGSVIMDQVETEKKESRTKFPHEHWTLAQFLDQYNNSNIYSTANTPKGLSDEVYFLPPMNCGGYTRRLQSSVLWFSSGDTKSVIHNDGQQNFHCMFAGTKQWILWDPRSNIATKQMGWVNAEEEAKHDPSLKDAYGTYAARIDVDNVDVNRFPGWSKLKWWNMTLQAGDCAFIPSGWFHYVEAPRQRSISVHVWFHGGNKFDEASCDKLKSRGFSTSDFLISLADCNWGWGDPDSASHRKPTKCKYHKKPLVVTDGAAPDASLPKPDEL